MMWSIPRFKVIYSAGSWIYNLKCEDLSVNEKTYKTFQETFDSFRCYIDCTSLQKLEVWSTVHITWSDTFV